MSRPFSSESPFRAIAHPIRRRILELLHKGERSVNDLLSNFNVSQPTLSRHLRVLHTCGILSVRRRGTHLMYRYAPHTLDQVRQWMKSV